MRALVAIALANLPRRWWTSYEERLPVRRYAWLSAIATLVAGVAIGIPGFLSYLGAAADGMNRALVAAQSDLVQLRGPLLLALPIFMLTTPPGLLSTYLIISGIGRFAAAFITDEPQGDWVLTGADAVARRVWRDTSAWDARRSREKREGADAPDRLVTGEWLGRPEIELAVLAARRKDWPRGAYLVNGDGQAYRIGEACDLSTRSGLRTVYPLTALTTGEAIRHAIPYELPPIWRQPR